MKHWWDRFISKMKNKVTYEISLEQIFYFKCISQEPLQNSELLNINLLFFIYKYKFVEIYGISSRNVQIFSFLPFTWRFYCGFMFFLWKHNSNYINFEKDSSVIGQWYYSVAEKLNAEQIGNFRFPFGKSPGTLVI